MQMCSAFFWTTYDLQRVAYLLARSNCLLSSSRFDHDDIDMPLPSIKDGQERMKAVQDLRHSAAFSAVALNTLLFLVV